MNNIAAFYFLYSIKLQAQHMDPFVAIAGNYIAKDSTDVAVYNGSSYMLVEAGSSMWSASFSPLRQDTPRWQMSE